MTPAFSRTSINSSTLVQYLAHLDVVDIADSKQGLAERLGQWMDWTDAISLSAVLGVESGPPPAEARAGAPCAAEPVVEEAARVRRDLADAIRAEFAAPAGTPGRARPPPGAAPPPEAAPDPASYRRRYLAHQRAMETRIGALRASVRAVLASRSRRLGRLAALDAVLDKALQAREQHLLGSVPALLHKHFEQLQQRHPASVPKPPPESIEAAAPARPPLWLARYGADVRAVLLAELEIRWQPVEGLLQALGNETRKS